MDSKPLAFGIVGFLLGGLIVSLAAAQDSRGSTTASNEMTMTQMTESLRDKKGNAYDAAFIESMIEHHQAALDMAKLSGSRAEHGEIKELSKNIIAAQEHEIAQMKQWRTEWNLPQQDNAPMNMP